MFHVDFNWFIYLHIIAIFTVIVDFILFVYFQFGKICLNFLDTEQSVNEVEFAASFLTKNKRVL